MKTGRPKKPADERKSATLNVRMTAAEKATVETVAGGNPSEWARSILLRAAKRRTNESGRSRD